jgi:hypothetical protein
MRVIAVIPIPQRTGGWMSEISLHSDNGSLTLTVEPAGLSVDRGARPFYTDPTMERGSGGPSPRYNTEPPRGGDLRHGAVLEALTLIAERPEWFNLTLSSGSVGCAA